MSHESAIVEGEFVTYSHLKTRKTFAITIEFPEEKALHVINTLGMPIGGESKPVAVALLDKEILNQSNPTPLKEEQTEGEKLRIRAVLLCRDSEFQQFITTFMPGNGIASESECAWFIKADMNIKSRSELATNLDAQTKFKDLLQKFESWKLEKQYADNFSKG